MLTKNIKTKQIERNIKSNYIIKPKNISQELSVSSKSLSINDLLCYSPIGRNKTKTMITSLLSSSKGIIINRRQYISSTNFPKKFRHFYPFKPNNSQILNFSNNEEKTKLILSPKLNESRNINEYSSPKSTKNSFHTIRPNTAKNKVNHNKCYRLRNYQLYLNKDRYWVRPSNINLYKFKNNDKENEKNNTNESISDKKDIKEYLNENKFKDFIDEMNKNNNYIIKCKNKIKEYFVTDNKKNEKKSFFEDLLYKYRFDDNEYENYFLKDKYSTKKNSFNIGNLKISFKINSLQFIFYEIKEDKQKIKNIDNKIFLDIENNKNINYNINTKIKFPFEFLSVFYGIDLNEFLNLLISLIEFNYQENKFNIENNNFITKTEMSKTLYDFYTSSSYYHLYNYNNSKECLLYDWDVKNEDNTVRHFVLKILLPQMKINIKCGNKNKIRFVSNISIKNMGELINNSFNKWDYFILIYFSELKLFRFEINKILCGKYINNDNQNENKNFNNKKNIKKITFNLNHINIILNAIKKRDGSYGFFYSKKGFEKDKNETYYINLKLPKISISCQNLLYFFNKKFDIDIKRLSQINKLRNSFLPEDLIKYSMIIIKSRNNNKESELDRQKFRKIFSSKKTVAPFKRSSSIFSRDRKRSDSKRSNNSNKSNEPQKKILKKDGQSNIKFTKIFSANEEYIKDIQLNLDKYIFNFDESILKFIKVKDNYKNKNMNNNESNNKKIENSKNNFHNEDLTKKNVKFGKLLRSNSFNISKKNIDMANNNEQKLNIEIGTIEMSWTNQEALTKNIMMNKKDTEYLLDHPPYQWKFFVEKNIEKMLIEEANLVKPIRRSSKKNFYWKDLMTKKEI